MGVRLPETFVMKLRFDSDWHVGSGVGRPGSIDRLVRVDPSGYPFVPGKTITGVWRDACELVARGLDDGRVGPWCRWVDYVFGRQARDASGEATTPAQLSVRPARLSENLRVALHAKGRLRSALTFVKWSVAIDPRSGRARDRFLRQIEMARLGLRLEAPCTLALPDESREIATALLAAGTRMVDRLGGKRRRGAGRCRLVIDALEGDVLEDCISLLERIDVPPEPPALQPSGVREREVAQSDRTFASSSVQTSESDPPDQGWLSVPLLLETVTPVVIEARTVGNVIETQDFVTGSRLLPIVTRALRGVKPDIDLDVFADALRVSAATVDIDGEAGVPVPRCLVRPKGESGLAAREGSTPIVRNLLAEPWSLDVPAKEQQGWIGDAPAGTLPRLAQVPVRANTHATIDDASQRPTAAVGGVFTLEAIDAGVRLRAEVRVRAGLARELERLDHGWWRHLVGSTTLGRSKKDDYGLVELRVDAPEPLPVHSAPPDRGREIVLWLVSDTLLLDEELRPATGVEALLREVSSRLGVAMSVRRSEGTDDRRRHLFVRIRRTDTWQAQWNLPRPSLVGMAGGSVFAFVAERPVSPDELARLEIEGVGERRAEGFGRVRVNHPLVTDAIADWSLQARSQKSPTSAGTVAPLLSEDSSEFHVARFLERAAWRAAIAEHSMLVADRAPEQLLWKSDGRPTMSQLSALRDAIAQLRSDADATAVARWIERIEGNERRRRSWPSGSLDILRRLVDDRERVWRMLDLPEEDLVSTEGARDALRNELWPEAVRTLVSTAVTQHRRAVGG